jgi:hypothetical protein
MAAGPEQMKRVHLALLAIGWVVWALLIPALVPAPAQAQASYQDGDLVQAAGDEKIHLVEAGRRRWIADTASLQQLNPDFTRLRRVSFEDVDRLPAGRPYRQLPLIRDAASGKIYLLTRETTWPAPRKHWINDLDSFTRLGFEWGDVALDWPRRPEEYADAPALTYRPVSREQTAFTNDQGTFLAVPAWRLQVQDDRLLMGLVVANTYNSEWREQVGARLAAQGTWIEWGTLPEGAAGRLDARLNRITVSRELDHEALGVLAAVLSHEVYHAVTTHRQDAAACFAEETAAFSWEAKTWSSLPPQWRSRSRFGLLLDGLVQAWRAGRVADLVANEPAYQRQCIR